MPALIRAQQAQQPTAATSPDWLEIPLTTVSLDSSFDSYVSIGFKGAAQLTPHQLVVDSGNSTLIVPYWEDLHALPNYAQDYEEILVGVQEPWGCQANIMRGPVNLQTTSGATYTIEDCLFFACTADLPPNADGTPADPPRTANFGTGCLNPWPVSTYKFADGSDIILKSPLSYDAAYAYAEFDFAAAPDVHDDTGQAKAAGGSFLRLYKACPAGYQLFDILPGYDWMSLRPKSLKIAGQATQWPGNQQPSIAMIDTGGGPIFLSDPNGYLYNRVWPNPVDNPGWVTDPPPVSVQCESTKDVVTVEIGDGTARSYTYTVDTSAFPATVQGLTLVMCELNQYMRNNYGMNIGGISALVNSILIDYADSRVGFKPQ
jgi:hypothetical protein